jgi:5-methylcytosine-specific restriction endonuclease McrA
MSEEKTDPIKEQGDRSCDVKEWSPSCERGDYQSQGDKYLCAVCGKITKLDHEMHHEHFPHLSGDPSVMH